MSLSKENQWKYLSIASSIVMGTYLVVDFLARRKQKQGSTRARARSTLTIQTDQLDEASKKNLDYVRTPTFIQNRIYSTDFNFVKPEKIPAYKICLTGGPCAGKTTSLAFLSERLSERGFRVFTVPETPTMTVQGGGMIIMGGLTPENVMKFQSYLMKMQMKIEDYFMELAIMSGEPSVVLCDRGVLDPYAYMSDDCWHSILDEQGWSPVILRDRRYDAVVHLVTAADGAEEFYTLENNQARYESVETAVKVDRRTQLAWIGHPNFAIVDNTVKGFQVKLNKVLGAVSNFLKLDFSTKIFEKYLIEKFDLPENIKRETFQVEESFLVAETDSHGQKRHKIRKRTQKGTCSYMHSMRIITVTKTFHEVKKNITAREYMVLLSKKDENLITTVKNRTSFIWENQSIMVDQFLNTAEKATVLKISVLEKGEKVRIPDFIKIVKNITDEPNYSTFALAHKKN